MPDSTTPEVLVHANPVWSQERIPRLPTVPVELAHLPVDRMALRWVEVPGILGETELA